jgi:hypothetical protein
MRQLALSKRKPKEHDMTIATRPNYYTVRFGWQRQSYGLTIYLPRLVIELRW